MTPERLTEIRERLDAFAMNNDHTVRMYRQDVADLLAAYDDMRGERDLLGAHLTIMQGERDQARRERDLNREAYDDAERLVKRLVRERDEALASYDKALDQSVIALADVAYLRDALRFYANPDNYEYGVVIGERQSDGVVRYDGGQRARTALGEAE